MQDKKHIATDPLVSVIIPCHSCHSTIRRTLQSVIQQTYKNIEIICVIDGIDRKLHNVIRSIAYEKLQIVIHDRNMGVGVARNTGIENSSGTYIAFLDADDDWSDTKLEQQISFMQRMNASISCCQVTYGSFSQENNFHKKYEKIPRKIYSKAHIPSLLIENKIITSSVVAKRKIFDIHKFKPIRNRQDLILWCEILSSGTSIFALQVPLTRYDLSTNGISANKLKMINANYRAYRIITHSAVASFLFVALSLMKRVLLEAGRRVR